MDVIIFFALFLLFMRCIIPVILFIVSWAQRMTRELRQRLDDNYNDFVESQRVRYEQLGVVNSKSDIMDDWVSDLKAQGFGEDWASCDETKTQPSLHLICGITAEQFENARAKMNSGIVLLPKANVIRALK